MRTLRLLTCLVLITHVAQAFAAALPSRFEYYPENFYLKVESGVRDQALKSELFEVLSMDHSRTAGQHDQLMFKCQDPNKCIRHTSLGYLRARQVMFGNLHAIQSAQGTFSVRDVYCQQMIATRGPGQIPDPTVLNAEHTWPQSLFSQRFNKDLQKSDLHILFPVLSVANSSRGNDEFGEVVTRISSPCATSARGYTNDGTTRIVFEVPDDHKGNVARAIFYFSTRYQLELKPNQENSLRAWHLSDPIDAAEIARNAEIFSNQHNRNPFIDHPELVELISDF